MAMSLCFTAICPTLLLALDMSATNPESLSEKYRNPGPHPVGEVLYDWHDEQRDRDVPVKIYYPKDSVGPFPVIVFSHGLGGSREGYAYLGRHWASHGYVSVHVQHVGSDESVWKNQTGRAERMKRAAADPRNALNRPADIHFVLDCLERLQREDGPLKGRLDLSRIGMAGHSFGAFTTMAIAGQVFLTPTGRSATTDDWRIKAAIVMSPMPPFRHTNYDEAYAQIRIPILHMTGTRDDSPIGETEAAARRIPFDHIANAQQYLVIFKDGNHMVFTGRKRLRGEENHRDARLQGLIRMSTTAFWDAHLKKDAAAKAWLAEGGFEKAMGNDGTFEKKAPASRPAR
jgi:predicted dienelactone hydrolase